jgi:hypothetical protein
VTNSQTTATAGAIPAPRPAPDAHPAVTLPGSPFPLKTVAQVSSGLFRCRLALVGWRRSWGVVRPAGIGGRLA